MAWLESIFHDARFGFRMLLKDRAVAAAAIVSLALTIGACTAAFSLIDALLLRPLPVPNSSQLVAFTFPDPYGHPFDGEVFHYAQFQKFREAAGTRVDLFGLTYGGGLRSVVFDNADEKVRAEGLSSDGFAILGIRPVIGRLFNSNDEVSSGSRSVAVLSYNFWNQRFGRSPSVLGKWFTSGGVQLQIIGVGPKGFTGVEPGYATDLWTPVEQPQNPNASLRDSTSWFRVWGRLKPSVDQEQARQILQASFTNFRREHVNEMLRPGTPPQLVENFLNAPLHVRSAARGSQSMVKMEFERPLLILAAVVGLVLLIACSNVANLLVARAAVREREMAMRLSIGASRMRLVRQLLVECSLLAFAACVLGLIFASWTAPLMVNLLSPSDYPAYLDLHVDWRMLAFLAAIGAVTIGFFGLIPAVRASGVAPFDALKTGGGSQSGRTGLLRMLLAAEVGFSFMVLFIAGLLLISFQRLTSVDLGFAKNGVILFSIQAKDINGEKARVASLELIDHVRQLPNVEGAGLSAQGLIGGNFMWIMTPVIRFAGRETESVRPRYLAVSPGFFETMQIRITDGRSFAARDTDPNSAAVVVNQSFARQFFPNENPVGKRFERIGDDPEPTPQEIVGVIRDAKYNNLREPPTPTVYEPLRGVTGTLEVRTATNPAPLATSLREEIQRFNPALRVTGVTLQSTQINNTLLRERLLALLSGFFAMVALVLAGVGLYGVLSYSVVRRTKEIGIRVALGAEQARVVRLVLSDLLIVIGAGVIAGAAGGFALSQYLASLLFEVKPSDVGSLLLPLACLLIATAIATLAPAIRVARVDPIIALRYE